ncbi:MAG: holo-ACP synthase, partial [Actinomycetota bacterium]|nr:holo-ACP synthase [Actinomycetota bacterium]
MRILGIGVDVVEVDRVRRMMERRSAFRDRVFTPSEVGHCDAGARPEACYAARWAAREACAKALGGIPDVRWHDIRVESDPAPRLILSGSARARAEAVGATDVLVSLAHERTVA